MEFVGGEYKFEDAKEQKLYNELMGYVNSYYKTRKDLKRFLSNARYIRDTQKNTYLQCFKEDVNAILYIITLEYPTLTYLYEDYKNKKEGNLLEYVVQKSATRIVYLLKKENLI